IVPADSQATKSATKKTSASMTTMRMPPSWSAVSLAITVPSPVQGEPRRRPGGRSFGGMASLLEIAVVDFVQAWRGEFEADQLHLSRWARRDHGRQIARAVGAIEVRPKHLHPDDAGDPGEPLPYDRAAGLDIDDMTAAQHIAGEFGHRTR